MPVNWAVLRDVVDLFSAHYSTLGSGQGSKNWLPDVLVRCGNMLTSRCVPKKEELLGAFPRKEHPLAGKKANVFLDLLLRDVKTVDPSYLDLIGEACLDGSLKGLTDDQMCSCVIYGCSLAPSLGFRAAFQVGVVSCRKPEVAKGLSDLLKALGANTISSFRPLCETHTLQGRAVNRVDLFSDAVRRTGSAEGSPIVKVDQRALREAVDAVLDVELPGRVKVDDMAHFWNSRFRWCVGGSHSLTTNESWLPRSALPTLGTRGQWNRRAALECVRVNPMPKWDGGVRVSVIEKLEHGKSRAIYSCDTLSYVMFSWILEPVETAWKGENVVLDPGRDGCSGIISRIRGKTQSMNKPCYVMCDYSDFNSQHSNASMRTVFSAVLDRLDGVSPSDREKILGSFDNTHLFLSGKALGRVGGTLMSGHRATTFINSVLNAAYVRLAVGPVEYDHLRPLHVGDDILMFSRDCEEAWDAIYSLESLGCGLQRQKQSVGFLGFEFLRMAGEPRRGVGGYLARSIAGLVSGNWVTDLVPKPREALHSMIHQARSIINRSMNDGAWRLLVSSTEALTRIPRDILCELLSGEVALAPGPCYRGDRRYVARHIVWRSENLCEGSQDVLIRGVPLRTLPVFGSLDYIYGGCSRVERLGLELAGSVPLRQMALAAYSPMEPSVLGGQNHRRPPWLSIGPKTYRVKSARKNLSSITTTAAQHGVLSQFPLLALLKNSFSTEDVIVLLQEIGVHKGEDALLTAWGGTNEGVTVEIGRAHV